jgi:ornithine carbamoyltransferase
VIVDFIKPLEKPQGFFLFFKIMTHFLSLTGLEPEFLQNLLEKSVTLHSSDQQVLSGKNILFTFEKPSLRTKIGTEAAITSLGGNVIHIEPENFFGGNILHAGEKNPSKGRESLKDTVKNVSLWCDAIFARVFSHETLLAMKQYSSIPIINALCDRHHPMQALADLKTIQDTIGKDEKTTVAFIGDANNVAYSLIEILLLFGHDVHFSGPEEYIWTEKDIHHFSTLASQNHGTFQSMPDPFTAVRGSQFVYTDTFVSMGEEKEYENKITAFAKYQVNEELLAHANDAYFMHCLPAHRGVEVTDEVIDSKKSLVYAQAKNRMVVSKGVFSHFIEK